jgi:response regulator RpfG family c-di-GMP phosphodiesterase
VNAEQNIYQVLREAEERMYETKNVFARQNCRRILTELRARLLEKQPATREHLRRLKTLISDTAPALQLSRKDAEILAMVADLHEIGKIAVSDNILKKQGRLQPQEWEAMKNHADNAYRIARTFSDLAPAAAILLALNERWDGHGYPRELKEGGIPYLARLFAIFDAFDSMTHERAYGRTLTVNEALEELRHCAGKQFDPELAEKFAAVLRQREPALA